MFQTNPLCVMCEAKGLVTAATELDHIVPLCKGGPDTTENCQPLCTACHKQKTLGDIPRKKGADIHGMPTSPEHWWNQ